MVLQETCVVTFSHNHSIHLFIHLSITQIRPILQGKLNCSWVTTSLLLPTCSVLKIHHGKGCMLPIPSTTLAPFNRWGTDLPLGCTTYEVRTWHGCGWPFSSVWRCYGPCTCGHSWWPYPSPRVLVFRFLPYLHLLSPCYAPIPLTQLFSIWLKLLRVTLLWTSHHHHSQPNNLSHYHFMVTPLKCFI